jgi:hypothetical protein
VREHEKRDESSGGADAIYCERQTMGPLICPRDKHSVLVPRTVGCQCLWVRVERIKFTSPNRRQGTARRHLGLLLDHSKGIGADRSQRSIKPPLVGLRRQAVAGSYSISTVYPLALREIGDFMTPGHSTKVASICGGSPPKVVKANHGDISSTGSSAKVGGDRPRRPESVSGIRVDCPARERPSCADLTSSIHHRSSDSKVW